MNIMKSTDFWAGLMFIGFGLLFLIVASDYRMGNATRMGPAYFPTLLGGLTVLLGGVIFFHSFTVKGAQVPKIHFRPLFFVILSLLLFGYLLKPIGLVCAVALLIVLSAFAGAEFKMKEAVLLSLLMIAFALIVFVLGLGLPFPLWPKWLG